MKYPPLLILPIVLAVSQAWADTDPVPEETVTLSPVTVTGTQQQKANRVTFNPKAALQPLPAGDGDRGKGNCFFRYRVSVSPCLGYG